jgi:Fe-S cluster assembly iron-binding protein IscA
MTDAVLMQHKKSIAYLSQKLGSNNQRLFIYRKELLTLITVMIKWKHYLIDNEFIIKNRPNKLKTLSWPKCTHNTSTQRT